MRKIRFRAWNPGRTKIVEIIDYKNQGENPNFNWMFRHYDSPKSQWDFKPKYTYLLIEQYTGVKDANGKEIYEGDIIKMLPDSLNGEEIVEVKWRNEGFWGYFNAFDNCEIIGNIHENPELID